MDAKFSGGSGSSSPGLCAKGVSCGCGGERCANTLLALIATQILTTVPEVIRFYQKKVKHKQPFPEI